MGQWPSVVSTNEQTLGRKPAQRAAGSLRVKVALHPEG